MRIYSTGSGYFSDIQTVDVHTEHLWECSFCGSSNFSDGLKCVSCGAARKRTASYYATRSRIIYADDAVEGVKKKSLFGRLFGG